MLSLYVTCQHDKVRGRPRHTTKGPVLLEPMFRFHRDVLYWCSCKYPLSTRLYIRMYRPSINQVLGLKSLNPVSERRIVKNNSTYILDMHQRLSIKFSF